MTGYSGLADFHVCCCVGPQNGDPLCPCQMREVGVFGDRLVRVQDLGPRPKRPSKPDWPSDWPVRPID